jgi:hypothetical protein
MNDARHILETIISDFSVDKFSKFFRAKSQKFIAREESYSHYNDDSFKNGQKVGEVNFADLDSLLICSFEVTKPLSERAGKKAQYEKAKSILTSTVNQKFSAGIFIYYDSSGSFRFSLVYYDPIGVKRKWINFRRFTYFISREFTNKTFLKQIGDKEFTKLDDIKDAFSITAVTDLFYDEFFTIYDNIVKQTESINNIDKENSARQFVLLFAIRTVFIGFIQKKKWLGNDEKFIQSFYQEYKNKYDGENNFYSRWLSPLFFEALNFPPGRKVAYRNNDFSQDTEVKLQMAPYLNGGLFRQKQGYDTNGWILSDWAVESFFNFLFSHSFTIEENSLEDEDLQLNPEFLGIIFERLVNKDNGAVYTHRPEVDLMCRLSLVKWLEKNLENPIKPDNLYELFFKESEKEDEQKHGSFSQKEAQEILGKLEGLAICDPAVGSGAFLVGMMQVLDGVEQSLRSRYSLGETNLFERKKQIIKNTLYGVEVQEWAVWICQLRLWLSLFVDAPDSLKESLEPILPSLDFKVRTGDSLVQRVGAKGISISVDKSVVAGQLFKQLRELIQLKTAYYDTGKPTINDIKHREFLFYYDWIQQDITKEQKKLIQYNIGDPATNTQPDLFGTHIVEPQIKLNLYKKEREDTVDKLEQLKAQLRDLHETKLPFLWQLEFSEVFSTKGGFDIVIGNPPYVRQEDIADPTGMVQDKKEYKNYLQEMVKLDFPEYFLPKTTINAQSDLYTYFYIRALRLLNPKGIHTFICSNSWLDVGYGTWLQEFLLNRCPVELIIDNHAKRSFKSADVNTIISILHAPQKKVDNGHIVRFVAFKKPFESAIFTENLIAIENAREVLTNDTFRVYPISNNDLKEAGIDSDDEAQTSLKLGKYVGGKWGVSYITQPDIVTNILSKNNFIRLNKIATPRFGVHTGLNDFYYPSPENLERFEIESEYLFPIITSPSQVQSIYLSIESVTTKLFFCPLSINQLKEKNHKGALSYILWASTQKTSKGQKREAGIPWSKVRSVKDRMPGWWALPISKLKTSRVFLQYRTRVTFYSVLTNDPIASHVCFHNINQSKYKEELLHAYLNTTLAILFRESYGRKYGGGGGPLESATVDWARLWVIEKLENLQSSLCTAIDKLQTRRPLDIFSECGINPESGTMIERQDPQPLLDRAELDNIVFDALQLSESERKDVYRAVCSLVWNRISKASSL